MQPNDERGDRAPLPSAAEDAGASSSGAHRPGSRLRLRNWRVRWRLIALILIPTIVAVAFGGLRVSAAAGSAGAYSRLERLAELGSAITGLVHDLGTERDLTAAYIAAGRGSAEFGGVQQQYRKVDAAAVAVRRLAGGIGGAYGSQVVANATRMRNRLDGIANLRTNATKTEMPASTVIVVYSESISDLLAFNDVITQGAADGRLTETARAMVAVSRAKEQASEQRGLLYSSTVNGVFGPIELTSLAAARSREDSEVASFREAATPGQRQFYDDTVIGPQVDLFSVLRERAISLGLSGRGGRHLDLDPTTSQDGNEWLKAATTEIDLMRVVERKLADEVIAGTQAQKSRATQSAILSAVAVVVVLLLVLLVTLVMAQSLVGPLRRLRAGALDVAGNRLPDLVRRLRDLDAGNETLHVEPIDVHTTDEIGEVARSFDEVHREAVRLASNEALLRGNVNAMFVNLSRRSQSLIERQLRLIEDLEQTEQDSGRLDSLFKLDHLATRMRRNCENLLVLGGQEQARRWNKPVPLVDIVRASLSEVEQYSRITLRIQDDVSVAGRSVNDLVHLVAELVENSTSFSPEHTKVAVSGHLLSGGGAMLQISDNGVGMSPEQLEEANWRLANPPTIDVSVSRRMGLFVVGRLAQRHGIRVELRAALSGGLTAFVILPASSIMQDTDTDTPFTPQRLDPPVDTPVTGSSVVGSQAAGSSAARPQVAGPPAGRRQLPPSAEPARPAPVPDTPREPTRTPSTPLPKRKSAPTAPPGRGVAPTAPARSAPPRPQSPPPPARPPSRPSVVGPAVGESRSANQNSGRSPIFEAMQSEWFQRRKTGSMSRSESPPPPEWSSPGDDGWRAAESVRAPSVGGQTGSGLPKRVPGSNRIPGTAGAASKVRQPAPPPVAQPEARPAAQPPQAEAVRNRFASFQQGVRKGRAAIRPEDDERENQ
jgi:signal transduction histidine kinase